MEQGVLRWSRKIETEQEPEFAILIVNAIIFLISQISPLHYCFYFTSVMVKCLWRRFSVRQQTSSEQIPKLIICSECSVLSWGYTAKAQS